MNLGRPTLYTGALQLIHTVSLSLLGKACDNSPSRGLREGRAPVCPTISTEELFSLQPLLMRPGAGGDLTTQEGWEQPLALMRLAA